MVLIKIILDFYNIFYILLYVIIDYFNIFIDDEYDSDKGKEIYNECLFEIEIEIIIVRFENVLIEMLNL